MEASIYFMLHLTYILRILLTIISLNFKIADKITSRRVSAEKTYFRAS